MIERFCFFGGAFGRRGRAEAGLRPSSIQGMDWQG